MRPNGLQQSWIAVTNAIAFNRRVRTNHVELEGSALVQFSPDVRITAARNEDSNRIFPLADDSISCS